MDTRLDSAAFSLLYVAPLRSKDLSEIAASARAAKVTTVTGVPDYLQSGLAVSVRRQGGRPKLLVNLRAARLEGADFKAELLKLAEISR